MVNPLLKEKKYLLFSMSRRNTGTDNVFTMLDRVFREALYLGRIPAIGKFTIGPMHNLGKGKSHLCFEDYLDLSNGITYRLGKGCHRPIASHLDWVKEEDLNLESYFFDQVYFLSDEEIVTEEINNRYDVVVRRDPTFKYAQTHKEYKDDTISIEFPYSKKVNTLTDEVLDVLGTSRTRAMAAQQYFLNRVDSVGFSCGSMDENTLANDISLETSYYACMHVRASDREYRWPIFALTSSKDQIKLVMKHAASKGSRVYIMSDVHKVDFFDFLKSDYQIYRYYDFPLLKRLVSRDDGTIDNVMLYLVEKNIMKYATVKILPPHKGPMIYHANTVYDVSFLKGLPAARARPTPFQVFIGDCMQKLGLRRIFDRIMSG